MVRTRSFHCQDKNILISDLQLLKNICVFNLRQSVQFYKSKIKLFSQNCDLEKQNMKCDWKIILLNISSKSTKHFFPAKVEVIQ